MPSTSGPLILPYPAETDDIDPHDDLKRLADTMDAARADIVTDGTFTAEFAKAKGGQTLKPFGDIKLHSNGFVVVMTLDIVLTVTVLDNRLDPAGVLPATSSTIDINDGYPLHVADIPAQFAPKVSVFIFPVTDHIGNAWNMILVGNPAPWGSPGQIHFQYNGSGWQQNFTSGGGWGIGSKEIVTCGFISSVAWGVH